MAIRAVLTDIEGTTSSNAFVKDVLFPYARRALPGFVRDHAREPAVRAQLDAVWREAKTAEGDVEGAIDALLGWIDEDRKVTSLKALQGMVWERGFRGGDFKAHVYLDAVERLAAWRDAGVELYVYSSGSVQAQRLFFEFSEGGDLLPLFRGFFDTTVGAKREPGSYRAIGSSIGRDPGEVLFLSDIAEELDAARAVGVRVCQLVRAEDHPALRVEDARHPAVRSFREVDLARW